jgi:hypothetical protein
MCKQKIMRVLESVDVGLTLFLGCNWAGLDERVHELRKIAHIYLKQSG